MNNLKDIASAIQLEINKRLPGIDAHKTMLPEGRTMPNNYLDNINNYNQSLEEFEKKKEEGFVDKTEQKSFLETLEKKKEEAVKAKNKLEAAVLISS